GLARRAAIDVVRTAAVRRYENGHRVAGEQLDAIRLDDRVQDERGARLALAVEAVAAMDEHRRRCEAIAHRTARASPFESRGHGRTVASPWRARRANAPSIRSAPCSRARTSAARSAARRTGGAR